MSSSAFQFSLLATDGAARSGEISMPRGKISTPAFMPVGTAITSTRLPGLIQPATPTDSSTFTAMAR